MEFKSSQSEDKKGQIASANEFISTNPSQLSFDDNRAESAQLRAQINVMNENAAQLRKDKALEDFGGKSSSQTSMKHIKHKSGGDGVYQFPYDSGYVIDSFQGTNMATAPSGYTKGSTPAYGTVDLTSVLSKDEIESGGRPLHFRKADEMLGISAGDRADKSTWHHLKTFGQMELIDMNVHGAMWHYGGIAKWGEHGGGNDGDDDEPSAE